MPSTLQSDAARWRRYCCQAMLAGLLVGALGMELVDRFPSSQSHPGTTAEAGSRTQQVQRLNADALKWAPPKTLFSGMVLLAGGYHEPAATVTPPKARSTVKDSDRAPPVVPN